EQLENLVVTPKEPRSERAVPRKLGKVGRNVVEEIDRSRRNDLPRLVYALGIRHVGEKGATTLARHMRTMAAILDAPVEALQTIALCSAVSFLLGAVLSGRTVTVPAPAAVSAEAVRDVPARARAAAAVPGAVNFADVAERINASVVNIDAASRAGRESRRRR